MDEEHQKNFLHELEEQKKKHAQHDPVSFLVIPSMFMVIYNILITFHLTASSSRKQSTVGRSMGERG